MAYDFCKYTTVGSNDGGESGGGGSDYSDINVTRIIMAFNTCGTSGLPL